LLLGQPHFTSCSFSAQLPSNLHILYREVILKAQNLILKGRELLHALSYIINFSLNHLSSLELLTT
ncbi:hypothetical protein, partial [Bacillus sp. AR18-7]|uniref:hypothetical protein n=1 Tax=Bacillus sp. AR18-7 TaxID=2217821 RepID=UPI001C551021